MNYLNIRKDAQGLTSVCNHFLINQGKDNLTDLVSKGGGQRPANFLVYEGQCSLFLKTTSFQDMIWIISIGYSTFRVGGEDNNFVSFFKTFCHKFEINEKFFLENDIKNDYFL